MTHSRNESSRLAQNAPDRQALLTYEFCRQAERLYGAEDSIAAIEVLESISGLLGASAALFVWVVQEGTSHCTYRSLSALDHQLVSTLVGRLPRDSNEWLFHATRSADPLLIEAKPPRSTDDDLDHDLAHNERPLLLVPASSPDGAAQFGMLCLVLDSHDDTVDARFLRPLLRGLALELSGWFQRRCREELVLRAGLTEKDLRLLRFEAQGQGSKRIGSALDIPAKTVDCRFHRLNARLGVASRRDAVRLCRLYGLL